jgi:hypothetical protein
MVLVKNTAGNVQLFLVVLLESFAALMVVAEKLQILHRIHVRKNLLAEQVTQDVKMDFADL